MLQLASPAFGKVTARRFLVMRPECQRTIVKHRITGDAEGHVAAAGRHPIAARRNADDQLVHPRRASARGIASARSSAMSWWPAMSAAFPCSQTAAQAESNAARPLARI